MIEIHSDGEGFEIEFSDGNGQMYKWSSFLAMEKPLNLTDEDIETLNRSIEEGKVLIKLNFLT